VNTKASGEHLDRRGAALRGLGFELVQGHRAAVLVERARHAEDGRDHAPIISRTPKIGYDSAVGKFFAAVILVIMIGWLSPMCARLGTQSPFVAAPEPVPQPEAPDAAPVAASTAALVSAGIVESAPKPATKRPSLTVATYGSRKMFPLVNDKYIVSVLRVNKADVPAVGVTMTLSTRMNGNVVERAESGPGQTLAPGSTSYFGLGVSNVVFEELLDRPAEPGNEMEWAVTYRFQDDAPGAKRCFRLRALPRRLEQGLNWLTIGESRKCGTPAE
jgi:hypothetical protein